MMHNQVDSYPDNFFLHQILIYNFIFDKKIIFHFIFGQILIFSFISDLIFSCDPIGIEDFPGETHPCHMHQDLKVLYGITYGLYMEKPMVETYKGEKNEKLKKKSKHVPDSAFVSPQLHGRS